MPLITACICEQASGVRTSWNPVLHGQPVASIETVIGTIEALGLPFNVQAFLFVVGCRRPSGAVYKATEVSCQKRVSAAVSQGGGVCLPGK